MSNPPRDQIESVLADIVKEALSARESAHIPGLGSFEVRHRTSTRHQSESGEVKFLPPKDEIVFTPEQ